MSFNIQAININGNPIAFLNQPTMSIRQMITNKYGPSYYPMIKFLVYNNDGSAVKVNDDKRKLTHFKLANIHKRGVIAIGIDNWRETPFKLKLVREFTSLSRWCAFIKKDSYKGPAPIEQCIDDLKSINCDVHLVDKWNDADNILKRYPFQPICVGQQDRYITNFVGQYQTYNKIPGYVDPQTYMQPRPYITKPCSF